MSLNNRPFAVVTGASTGIGKAVAINLIKQGFNVCILARSEDKLKKIATEYSTNTNDIKVIKCDALQPQQINSACKEIKTWSGDNINLLLNNVGGIKQFGSKYGNLHTMPIENWDHDINLNLRSSFLFTQQLLSSLKNAAKSPCKYNGNIYDASVINVSSVASTDPTVHQIAMAYSVAKAGLDQLTRLNAHELGKYKIRVNSLKLASIRTNVMEAAGLSKAESDAAYKEAAKPMALNKIGTLDDVSEMVNFLAMKNKSGWMTGANIDLDGGWLHGGGTTGVWSKM